jgi:hypothetical protein
LQCAIALVVIRQGGEVPGFSLRTIAIATLDSTRAAKTGNTNSVRLRNGGHKAQNSQALVIAVPKSHTGSGHRRQREIRGDCQLDLRFRDGSWRFEKQSRHRGEMTTSSRLSLRQIDASGLVLGLFFEAMNPLAGVREGRW